MPKFATAACVLALAAASGWATTFFWSPAKIVTPSKASIATTPTVPWVAAASGRVEPGSGEIRIGAGILGRITEVLAKENDLVEAGQLLVRLEDDEARARLVAAEAEVAARKSERDSHPQTAGREDLRRAEDALYIAERSMMGARFELDALLASRRSGNVTAQQIADSRRRLTEARDRLERERAGTALAQARHNVAPSRLDAALSAARASVSLAEAGLERTRVRASISGSVLQVLAKVGETVAPSPEQPLVIMGDMTSIRVKIEIDEGDVAKIRNGQRAFVKSPSHPDREFDGRIVSIAPMLAAQKLTNRGPRRPTDVDVLEVTVELDGRTALLPGIRVDAYVRRE